MKRILLPLLILSTLFLTSFDNPHHKIGTEKDSDQVYYDGDDYLLFVTPKRDLTINDILKGEYQEAFIHPNEIEPNTNDENDYWVKFELSNELLIPKDLLLIVYSHQSNEIDLFLPDDKGIYYQRTQGADFNFDSRQYDDNNFVFDIPLKKGNTTYYLKYKSDMPVNITFSMVSAKYFLKSHNNKYNTTFFLFGLIFMVIIYNIFLYIVSRKKAFLFFVAYALSSAIFILDLDGFGFQYLWPKHPKFNHYSFEITNGLMMTFALILSTNVLRLYRKELKLHYTHLVVIGIKVISLLFITNYLTDLIIDVFMLSLPIASAIYMRKENDHSVKVYLVASIILLVGYTLFTLRINNIVVGPFWMYSALKYTLILQCIVLSKSLTEKYRRSLLQVSTSAALSKKTAIAPEIMEENLELKKKITRYKRRLNMAHEKLDSRSKEYKEVKSELVYLKTQLQEIEQSSKLTT